MLAPLSGKSMGLFFAGVRSEPAIGGYKKAALNRFKAAFS
ncbi:hypothetical protein B4098_0686 [Heyndrickxia coagulans]|uniref:Uncharacterized protein n=1 Tax=Heyndrickxia coagulans TaxID=1398 RepID=A0A150K1I3_HEYCO|nr:hypothetical protein B4098_0686 [Heyndrickxia coagulans]